MKSMEGKLQKYRQKPEPMGRESSLLAVRIHVSRGSRQDLGPIAACGVASGRFLGSSKHETSGWGEASRIAFTGPSRPPKNSPIQFYPPTGCRLLSAEYGGLDPAIPHPGRVIKISR